MEQGNIMLPQQSRTEQAGVPWHSLVAYQRGWPVGGPAAAQAGLGYVSAGTYSLPVPLPEGEVKLDFARPGGQAELAVTAIPVSLIHSLWGTATVILALAIVGAVAAFLSRFVGPRQTRIRALCYAVILALLAIVAGLVGLVVALVLIGIIELARRATSRARENKAPAA